MDDREITVYPLYHPAFIRRPAGRRFADAFEAYLKEIPSLLTGGKNREVDIFDNTSTLSSTLYTENTLLSLDIETTGLYPRKDHFLRNGLYTGTNKPLSYRVSSIKDLDFTRRVFTSNTGKIVHNLGMEESWSYSLFRQGLVNVQGDTMLMARRLDEEQSVSLEVLASRRYPGKFAGYKLDTNEALEAGQAAWVDPAILAVRNGGDVEATWMLYQDLSKELGDKGMEQHRQYDLPIAKAVARLNLAGMAISRPALLEVQSQTLQKMAATASRMRYTARSPDLNPRSHPQVRAVLEKLGASTGKQTPAGKMATGKLGLLELAGQDTVSAEVSEFTSALLEYREAEKVHSTYAVGLGKLVENGRVYSDWRWPGTSTWRLSSSGPNLQNIPVRRELGRSVRKAFVSRWEGGWLVEADLSQIELRILACLSKDRNMVPILQAGGDLHGFTAERIFGKGFTPHQRYVAKTGNFTRVYQGGWEKIQDTLLKEAGLRVSNAEAMAVADGIDLAFPDVTRYMQDSMEDALAGKDMTAPVGGYTTRPASRIASARSHHERLEVARSAANFPIQCTGSILTLLGLARLYDILDPKDAVPCAVVHDSILVDCRSKEIACATSVTVTAALNDVCAAEPWFIVPAVSEAKVGQNWAEMTRP